MIFTAEDFGRKCAREAWANRTVLEDGKILVAEEPQSADWDAYREHVPDRGLAGAFAFERGYKAEIKALRGVK